MSENMNLTLKIWRQAGPDAKGELKEYKMTGVSPDMSFLEMLDVLNQQLVEKKEEVSRCTGKCDNCQNYTESYFCGFATPYCKLQGKEITHNVY